jgi:curved DNA-binding protein CbpA
MFLDYYSILEISINADDNEIKSAFKKQAFKWHPDKNANVDTTKKMQQINEAKLILLDMDARNLYNIEYLRFKQYTNEQETYNKQSFNNETKTNNNNDNQQFEFQSELLKKWVLNARKQAIELAKQSVKDFASMAYVGSKSCLTLLFNNLLFWGAISIIFYFFKSCNSN